MKLRSRDVPRRGVRRSKRILRKCATKEWLKRKAKKLFSCCQEHPSDEIDLYLEPRPTMLRSVPKFHHLLRVEQYEVQHVEGRINGQLTKIFVDSGATISAMPLEVVKKLSLLHRMEPFQNTMLSGFFGTQYLALNVLKDIPIVLSQGVTVYANFLVLPTKNPLGLNIPLIGNDVLRRYEVIQRIYRNHTASLHFKNPDLLNRPLADDQHHLYQLSAYRYVQDKPLGILIDTATSDNLVATSAIMRLGLRLDSGHKTAKIHLCQNRVIRANFRPHIQDNFDFLVGREFLVQYRAIIDYPSHLMYLRYKRKTFKTHIRFNSQKYE